MPCHMTWGLAAGFKLAEYISSVSVSFPFSICHSRQSPSRKYEFGRAWVNAPIALVDQLNSVDCGTYQLLLPQPAKCGAVWAASNGLVH